MDQTKTKTDYYGLDIWPASKEDFLDFSKNHISQKQELEYILWLAKRRWSFH